MLPKVRNTNILKRAILNLFKECCPVQYFAQSCFSRRNLFLVFVSWLRSGLQLEISWLQLPFIWQLNWGILHCLDVRTLHFLRWLWNTEDSHLLVEFGTETTETEFSGLVISLLTVRHKLARSWHTAKQQNALVDPCTFQSIMQEGVFSYTVCSCRQKNKQHQQLN